MHQERKPSQQPFFVNQPKERVLEALSDYYYMDAEQVCRRIYNTTTTVPKTRQHLTALWNNSYINRGSIGNHATHGGSGHAVYALATKGIRYLEGLGYDTAKRLPREIEFPDGDGYLKHTLAVNDFLLSATILCRDNPSYQISQMLHEQTLKRSKFKTTKRVGVNRPIPDAWLVLEVDGQGKLPIWLELDRGTEHISNFKKKVSALIAWHKSGAYQEEYGTELMTVAIVTTAGHVRAQEIRAWIEQELTVMGAQDYAPLFLVTATDAATVTPADVYANDCWTQPFSEHAVSLIPQ